MPIGLSREELQETYASFSQLHSQALDGRLQGALHGENPRFSKAITDAMKKLPPDTSPAVSGIVFRTGLDFLAILDTIDANNKAIAKALKK